jgi:predicted metal-dependent hydrolase
MSTKHHHIEVNGIQVEIVRKNIKNLHLAVYPPRGHVRVATPLRLDDEAVRLAVISRLGWIQRQQANFKDQDRQSDREMITGESHYVQGKRYRLDVVEHNGPPELRIKNNSTLELRVRPNKNRERKQEILLEWYRQRLKDQIPRLIAKWEPILGVSVAEWGVKKMKTHWGTCNIGAGRIWLNLELAKKPASCLEYILVHEMVHLHERLHNEQFQKLMDYHMPQWRYFKDQLNSMPLAHEDWLY